MPMSFKRSQGGFAMIAVLGFISVLSVLAGLVATWTESETLRAQLLRDKWQSELNVQATQATVLYRLATGIRTVNGYGGLANGEPDVQISDDPFSITSAHLKSARFKGDGTRYTGVGNTAFALQDEGALLSLLNPDDSRWQRLLNQHGLSMYETQRFLDILRDYTDQDDFRRLNGASDADYKAAGIALPSHRFMVSPAQVLNLLEATNHPWLRDELVNLTTRSGQVLQLNTMPIGVIETLPGMTPDKASTMVRERETKPYKNSSDLAARTGILMSDELMNIGLLPTQFVRITIWPDKAKCGVARWMGVTMTPSSMRAPWEIDYGFSYDTKAVCREDLPVLNAPL